VSSKKSSRTSALTSRNDLPIPSLEMTWLPIEANMRGRKAARATTSAKATVSLFLGLTNKCFNRYKDDILPILGAFVILLENPKTVFEILARVHRANPFLLLGLSRKSPAWNPSECAAPRRGRHCGRTSKSRASQKALYPPWPPYKLERLDSK